MGQFPCRFGMASLWLISYRAITGADNAFGPPAVSRTPTRPPRSRAGRWPSSRSRRLAQDGVSGILRDSPYPLVWI